MPIFVIYGEEPYLINKKQADVISDESAFCHQEFTPDTISQLWQDSFFSAKPCGIVELEDIKGLNESFFHYVDNPNKEAVLAVTIRNVDERTREFKALLERKGKVQLVRCDKLNDKSYQAFVMRMISGAGKCIQRDTFGHLMDCIGYEDHSEVTLYTCL